MSSPDAGGLDSGPLDPHAAAPRLPMPAGDLAARVRSLAEGTLVAPQPRDAATVLLLRQAPVGPEAYLLRRVRQMSFAGGMHVFPGGSVDPADAEASVGWAGPAVSAWADWLHCPEPLARALVCAAVRETFEEAGVLLAGPGPGEVLADVSSDEWEVERARLEAREQSLSQLLERRGLVVRSDLLRPLAHWITPEVEPKRFDTRFFLAELPAGQVCRDAGTEADNRVWVRPAQALEQDLAMLPPTRSALEAVAQAADVHEALLGTYDLTPVMPTFVLVDDGVVLRVPGAA